MTGSQQAGTPATDNTITTRNGQYTTSTPSTNVDPRNGSSGTGMSAQSTGPQYPAVVGPTGSHQQDATNPNRSSPTGGTSEAAAPAPAATAANASFADGLKNWRVARAQPAIFFACYAPSGCRMPPRGVAACSFSTESVPGSISFISTS